MSSKRRLYLGPKQSFREKFSAQVRWLKESYGPESIFEKPYRDTDYRQMHLDIPHGAGVVATKTPEDTRFLPKKSIWQFPPARCSMSQDNEAECGESFGGSAKVSGFFSIDDITWIITEDVAEVVNRSRTIDSWFQTIDWTHDSEVDYNGTVTICAQASIGASPREWTASWEIPQRKIGPFWVNDPGSVASVRLFPQTIHPAVTWRQTAAWAARILDCGCEEVVISCDECDCASVSPTINFTTQSMQINETQDLSITDSGSLEATCFTWSLSDGGGGSLSDLTGLTTTYTAPGSNAECADNATISLLCDGNTVDTLEIAVNEDSGAGVAYLTRVLDSCEVLCCSSGQPYISWTGTGTQYKCDGSILCTCSGDGTFAPSNDPDQCFGKMVVNLSIGCAGQGCGDPQWGTVEAITDRRDAAQLTAGCCPGALL